MDSYKSTVILNSLKIRSRRMKYFKIGVTTLVWILAIIPWIFCYQLYNRLSILNAQYKELNKQNIEISMELEEQSAYYDSSQVEDVMKQEVSVSTNTDNETTNNIASNDRLNIDRLSNGIPDKDFLDNSDTSTNIGSEIESEPLSNESSLTNNRDGFKDKKVYLTFDDGPSIYTEEILDILSEFNVKATFFVIGKTDEGSLEMYKRIVNDGHTLGMHSYSHNYNSIYNSLEDFDKDFTKLRDLLYDSTGYLPNIYRFPGGSANILNNNHRYDFIQYLDAKSVTYFDWNVVNGDATGENISQEQLVKNVISGVEKYEHSIVLMHDTNKKELTVHSLEELIETLTSQGASVLALDDTVKPIQQVKTNNNGGH